MSANGRRFGAGLTNTLTTNQTHNFLTLKLPSELTPRLTRSQLADRRLPVIFLYRNASNADVAKYFNLILC